MASILMLLFASRLSLRRWPFVLLSMLSGVALVAMLAMGDAWIVFWAGVIGFCNAFLLILALALPPLLGRADDVHRLAAGMIAIGYLCAFVIPIVGGFLWDATGAAPLAFAPLVVFSLAAIALGARLDFPAR